MATRGRLPMLSTLGNQLASLVDTSTSMSDSEAKAISNIAIVLKSNIIPSPKQFATMVESLDRIHNSTSMSDSEAKVLVHCIDALARHQVSPPAKKVPVAKKKASLLGKPQWMLDNEEAARALRDTSVEGIVGAIVVLLGEVKAGEAGDDDFDTIDHLLRAMRRIY